MSISPTSGLLYSASFGSSSVSAAQTGMFDTLMAEMTGTFDPFAAAPAASTLIDLSFSDASGQTMFDVLATSYGVVSPSTASLLSAYLTI